MTVDSFSVTVPNIPLHRHCHPHALGSELSGKRVLLKWKPGFFLKPTVVSLRTMQQEHGIFDGL
jgi:hypothetical protein